MKRSKKEKKRKKMVEGMRYPIVLLTRSETHTRKVRPRQEREGGKKKKEKKKSTEHKRATHSALERGWGGVKREAPFHWRARELMITNQHGFSCLNVLSGNPTTPQTFFCSLSIPPFP
jgi:hypothetical protein